MQHYTIYDIWAGQDPIPWATVEAASAEEALQTVADRIGPGVTVDGDALVVEDVPGVRVVARAEVAL
jgi:hypothetical protein